jgi:hypothetical protein
MKEIDVIDEKLVKNALELSQLVKRHVKAEAEAEAEADDEFTLYQINTRRIDLLELLAGDLHDVHRWIRLILYSLKYNQEFKESFELSTDLVMFLLALLKHTNTISEWFEECVVVEEELLKYVRTFLIE